MGAGRAEAAVLPVRDMDDLLMDDAATTEEEADMDGGMQEDWDRLFMFDNDAEDTVLREDADIYAEEVRNNGD